jgi:hypothetical protein
MNKYSSIFGQILQIFSKSEFYKAVKETRADKGLRDSVAGHNLKRCYSVN